MGDSFRRSLCSSTPHYACFILPIGCLSAPDAADDDLLTDALVYFARGDDWFDVYKALECLFCERKFLALGWVDEDKIRLLKRTADVKRHSWRGRSGVIPPPQPMERTEARELLVQLMARAFREAADTPRPPL
jgi:hypothetical protein